MKGNNDTFWTALINGNEVLYFTNKKRLGKKASPETIIKIGDGRDKSQQGNIYELKKMIQTEEC